jgi:hypothetical protein
MKTPDRAQAGKDQPTLPDPILTELDSNDIATRRCRGRTARRTRCSRTAPPWWPANLPWLCPSHDNRR